MTLENVVIKSQTPQRTEMEKEGPAEKALYFPKLYMILFLYLNSFYDKAQCSANAN